MLELALIMALTLCIMLVSFYSRAKLKRKRRQKTLRGIAELSKVLDLIQRLQRHRGLCANLTGDNLIQQKQLSIEIDQIWLSLLDKSYGGNQKRIHIQHKNWLNLQANPKDSFMPHCELIEKLLHELTVIADVCSLTASNNAYDCDDLWRNLLKRPQFAETLGRLRALGNKASSLKHCPADVKVQLQYQLANLRSHELYDDDAKQIEQLVVQEVLAPEVIQIEPRVYFNRVTQAIDQQIQRTREHLQQLS